MTIYKLIGSVIGTGILSTAGALAHAHAYKIRRRTAIISANYKKLAEPAQLRIVHISDTHLLARQNKRRAFIRSLVQLHPDFVVLTGDLIAEDRAIPALLADLGPLLTVPGAFVFGSNDYSGPELKNPLRYLAGHTGKSATESKDVVGQPLATDKLRSGLTSGGWIDLNNARQRVVVGDWTLDLVGIDDPHIDRHAMPAASHNDDVTGPHMRIALAHAPYTWVLDMMHDDGADITFAGHTHGGQVNLPGSRALVTNCDLPTSYSNGLFRWPAHPQDGNPTVIKRDGSVDSRGTMLVNISAGIGTSPYTPIRTFCAPEAIMIDVVQV
ncbi:metallophosphoesterase [Arcanobacterium phocisimile]|uniref:Metallophosphoesterase n=1 Tax=Arcanobacterium phocisimile TaxID=1302235 RepID=A0ABX7IG48_9ACTO|nr:metallophosphoesterase [Arcanobacterium phocisimile]QRV02098.1 metallophosphoesterase [Arcanobacterium phocisimile]